MRDPDPVIFLEHKATYRAVRGDAPDDADFMLDLLNQPSFVQNVGDRGVRTRDEARAYIGNGAVASYNRHGFGLYLVVLKETGDSLGAIPWGMATSQFFTDSIEELPRVFAEILEDLASQYLLAYDPANPAHIFGKVAVLPSDIPYLGLLNEEDGVGLCLVNLAYYVGPRNMYQEVPHRLRYDRQVEARLQRVHRVADDPGRREPQRCSDRGDAPSAGHPSEIIATGRMPSESPSASRTRASSKAPFQQAPRPVS